MAASERSGKAKGSPPSGQADVLVTIGVSSRSLSSLETLLAHLPPQAAAYVVVFSQGDGPTSEDLVDVAGRAGAAVELVSGRQQPQAGYVYAPAPGHTLMVDGKDLVGEPARQALGHRASIDSLITSAAEAYGSHAVGVLLHDIAPSGIASALALKDNGGLALGEPPIEGGDEIAPIDALGLIDLLLPAAEIGQRIGSYIETLRRIEAEKADGGLEQDIRGHLGPIATVLRNRTGHDFHGYKQNTFGRRVQRRMQVLQIQQVAAYLETLRTDPDEVGFLFQDLLIGVTSFFRDKPEFAVLEREAIPKLFEGRKSSDQVRVWVLGCATGEEAYSLGMLLREHMAGLDVCPSVQIFATDLDGRALNVARAGRYPESIAQDIGPERLARWFQHEGGAYTVVKELRDMCIFSQHNLTRDAPFSRIDLISCRNLLIYLTPELQERLIPLFHFALRPGGFLFLGASENVTKHAKLFAPVERRRRIFRRLEGLARPIPEFPLSTSQPPHGVREMRRPQKIRIDAAMRTRADLILERYAPAYVLVDQQYDVLQFSEHTGGLLQPSAGVASLNLLSLVHRRLRTDLRAGLQTAAKEQRRVEIDVLDILIDGSRRRIDLIIEPIVEGDGPAGFLVLFRDKGAAIATSLVDAVARRDEHALPLEAELRIANERLQATIEELEGANEEYQSRNEELQSANEELHTVNGELGYRVSELARANCDLKNLLENTQIAAVFLDNDLRVKSFTASMSEVYHLIEGDVGRAITDIAPRIRYPELRDDFRKVLRTLAPIEREVAGNEAGVRYLVRVLPYRSGDNFIAGAVITFADISDVVRVQAALSESEARYRMIVDSATDYGIITMDADRIITGWNPGAATIFGWSEDEMIGKPADQIFTPEDREVGAPEGEAETAVHDGRALDLRWHIRRDGSRFWGAGALMPLKDPALGFVKILHDRTHDRENEDRQRLLMAELQHRVKNILAVVRSMASRTLETTTDLSDFSAHFDGRLRALARTQNVLTRTAASHIDLEELVREELLTHSPRDAGQIEIGGPAISLKERAAEIFALALHELATNAVKYGALAQPRGHIAVTWRVLTSAEGGRLSLDWRESGVPALDPHPARHGFGRDLIERGLPYELGAATSLEFLPGGVHCTIELPLDVQGGAETEITRWSAGP